MKNLTLSALIYYGSLLALLLLVKFVIYSDALALLAFIVAAWLSGYVFVRSSGRLLKTRESLILAAANGLPGLIVFSLTDAPQMDPEFLVWAVKFFSVVMGLFVGFVVCLVFYTYHPIWLRYVHDSDS
ncbi:hypothetical protein BST95_02615 [Halioglobus japonicus]|uniref:Uncharacterized protein n=1 Tax=Halioglobus japonicus TaxID=930805 RepID=A0AAP8MB07_9GAMM|nr:hypothetical protein BST95_02615 [Halioglobus japonicus]PLW84508.1 hypothetical protein C0029_18835 [Halioglobus japonicus]GHD24523.1 hypothetical protein GCM10007052_38160 [Halioglobus japonicus]